MKSFENIHQFRDGDIVGFVLVHHCKHFKHFFFTDVKV